MKAFFVSSRKMMMVGCFVLFFNYFFHPQVKVKSLVPVKFCVAGTVLGKLSVIVFPAVLL